MMSTGKQLKKCLRLLRDTSGSLTSWSMKFMSLQVFNIILDQSVDKQDKAAKSVLGLMLETLFGRIAFIARLLPFFSLTGELLFDQIKKLIRIVQDAGGFLFLVICDNLHANQNA